MKEYGRKTNYSQTGEPILDRRDLCIMLLGLGAGFSLNHLRRVFGSHSIQLPPKAQPTEIPTAETESRPEPTLKPKKIQTIRKINEFELTPSKYKLKEYNNGSQIIDQIGNGAITIYKRDIDPTLPQDQKESGAMIYVIAFLGPKVSLRPLTAHDKGITTDDANLRDWTGGPNGLETPPSIAGRNMYLPNTGKLIFFASTDYFGEPNTTYPEGPFANKDLNEGVFAPNPQRPAICVTPDKQIFIDYLQDNELRRSCDYAWSGGSVVVSTDPNTQEILVAHPDIPLGQQQNGYKSLFDPQEYFANFGTREKQYLNTRPHAISGYGVTPDNRIYYIYACSNKKDTQVPGPTGLQLAEEARNMGAKSMIMHDDGSQTSWLWYGLKETFQGVEQDDIPTGIGIFYDIL